MLALTYRMSRRRYAGLLASSLLPVTLLAAQLLGIDQRLASGATVAWGEGILVALTIVGLFVTLFFASIARLNDIDRSPLYALLLLIPGVAGVAPLVFTLPASMPEACRRSVSRAGINPRHLPDTPPRVTRA